MCTSQCCKKRQERGATFFLVALGLGFLMAAAAFGVDHGRITTNRRSLQKIADVMALDATRPLDGRTTQDVRTEVEASILDSAVRNDFADSVAHTFVNGTASLGDGRVIEYAIGRFDRTTLEFAPTAETAVPEAIRIELTDDIGYFFQPGGATSTKSATGLLVPTEAFSLGSFVAGLTADPPQNVDLVDEQAARANEQVKRVKTRIMDAIYGRALSRFDDAPPQPADPEDPAAPQIPDSELGITVVGYEGLARTWVTLEEIRAVMGFATVEELMSAEIATRDFLVGLIDAVQLPDETAVTTGDPRVDNKLDAIADRVGAAGGDTSKFQDSTLTLVQPQPDGPTVLAAVEALGKAHAKTLPQKQIGCSSDDDNCNQTLGEFIHITEGFEDAAATARINVLQLFASAALINGGNFFAADVLVPVSSPDAVALDLPTQIDARIQRLRDRHPDIPDHVAIYEELTTAWPPETELLLTRAEVSLIEPPDIAVGPPGGADGSYLTVAETAQANVSLTVELPDVDIDEVLALLGLGPLDGVNTTVADVSLPVTITGGHADAGLRTLDCLDHTNNRPSVFDVNTSAFGLHFGTSPDLTVETASVEPAELFTIDALLADVVIDGSSDVTLAGASEPDFPVTGAYDPYNQYRIIAQPDGDLGASLWTNLTVDPVGLDLLGKTVDRGELARTVGREISKRIPLLHRDLLGPLSDSVDIGIGGADLTAFDITCDSRALAGD